MSKTFFVEQTIRVRWAVEADSDLAATEIANSRLDWLDHRSNELDGVLMPGVEPTVVRERSRAVVTKVSFGSDTRAVGGMGA